MFASVCAIPPGLKHLFKVAVASSSTIHGMSRSSLTCVRRRTGALARINLGVVADGTGFPDQDAHTPLRTTSSVAHFHGPLVHDLLRRLWRGVWFHCRKPL